MKLSVIAFLALIPSFALATGGHPTPVPEPQPIATATQGQLQGQLQGQKQTANGGEGIGSVEVGGDTDDFNAKALSLGQIRAFAAPAVPGECRIHTRGWDVTVASASGGTKFEKDCVADQRCYRAVEIYIRLGREAAALKQLAFCGGLLELPVEAVPEPKAAVPVTPPVDMSIYATKAEVNEKLDRVYKSSVGK